MAADQKLKELGIVLPVPPKPLGAYVESVQVGNMLFLSGTLPVEDGTVKFRGRIGSDMTIEDGRRATRLATLNALSLAREHLGSLDKVSRVVRLAVSLVASEDFRDHPRVADAASELLADVFGADRTSTRMVAGVLSLPVGVCVVVELVLALDAHLPLPSQPKENIQ